MTTFQDLRARFEQALPQGKIDTLARGILLQYAPAYRAFCEQSALDKQLGLFQRIEAAALEDRFIDSAPPDDAIRGLVPDLGADPTPDISGAGFQGALAAARLAKGTPAGAQIVVEDFLDQMAGRNADRVLSQEDRYSVFDFGPLQLSPETHSELEHYIDYLDGTSSVESFLVSCRDRAINDLED